MGERLELLWARFRLTIWDEVIGAIVLAVCVGLAFELTVGKAVLLGIGLVAYALTSRPE